MYNIVKREPPKPPIKRSTVNLPKDLLEDACAITGKGVTETLIEGLKQIRASSAWQIAQQLRGKIHIDLDVDELRGRRARR